MNEETQTNIEEKNFRVNIKQSAKGFCYFECTVRGDTSTQIEERLTLAIDIANKKCDQLNQTVQL